MTRFDSASVKTAAGVSASPVHASASSTVPGRTRGSSPSSISRWRSTARRRLRFSGDSCVERPWKVARATRDPLLERAIELTEQHRASVRSSLQHGVHDALTHLTRALAGAASARNASSPAAVSAFDEALVVIYRILFLLFAEARGLVPRWHPIYRDAYTIESLRGPVETLPAPVGVWETLQAIARLAHRGCRIGSLHVPPFNGRLFSPVHAPLADSVPLDDRVVRLAMLALTTRTGRGRMPAHRLRRSWRRAARRRLRAAAGFRPGQ